MSAMLSIRKVEFILKDLGAWFTCGQRMKFRVCLDLKGERKAESSCVYVCEGWGGGWGWGGGSAAEACSPAFVQLFQACMCVITGMHHPTKSGQVGEGLESLESQGKQSVKETCRVSDANQAHESGKTRFEPGREPRVC
jgi:hypothetical protein